MATFSKSTFSHSSYAAIRPSYPQSLYNRILSFHHGPRNLLLDLGTGHGLVPRALSSSFKQVIGTDPSPGMISQARSLTPNAEYPHITYEVAPAEELPFVQQESVDVVVAAQAAHWFDYPRLWKELRRVVRRGGTVAFWGYKDPVLVDFPKASKIMFHFGYDNRDDRLGPFWQQPGRSIVQDQLRKVQPPTGDWEEVTRVEYEPGTNGKRSGEGTPFLERRMKVGEVIEYVRTWSSYHAWREAHPEQVPLKDGGRGDVLDEMYQEMKDTERWENEDLEVDIEWGTSLVMARKT
ncbi:MAG: hypothetical protein M1821_006628 [Bathelium mastoideum]|nr:MAG: hypothetical protein M1821_006628 [Bathelium mastoideum]